MNHGSIWISGDISSSCLQFRTLFGTFALVDVRTDPWVARGGLLASGPRDFSAMMLVAGLLLSSAYQAHAVLLSTGTKVRVRLA